MSSNPSTNFGGDNFGGSALGGSAVPTPAATMPCRVSIQCCCCSENCSSHWYQCSSHCWSSCLSCSSHSIILSSHSACLSSARQKSSMMPCVCDVADVENGCGSDSPSINRACRSASGANIIQYFVHMLPSM